MKLLRLSFSLLLIVLAAVVGPGFVGRCFAASSPCEITLSRDTIEVGTGFAGGTVEVKGTVPEGSTVVVKVISSSKKVALSRKGRVSGLWMTVERAQVDGMPGMYKVFTSGKISDISPEVQQSLGVDREFTAARQLAKVTEKHEEKTVTVDPKTAKVFIDGLISLMAQKGLYTIKENAVKVSGSSFEATIDIPAYIPRGETKIEVYAVNKDAVVASSTATLNVVPVGLVKTLGDMAEHNAVVYGILAVLVALTAGITIAQFFKWLQRVIFKDEGVGAHH
ncbi:TIGR02186 family protein [Thermodesulfitimonas autotrophica]|uniref:TIGR02186 family protein n=1 Tax=Thermodesulfitimonas autotrophica TaxID=1894989 RepID=UPI002FE13B10